MSYHIQVAASQNLLNKMSQELFPLFKEKMVVSENFVVGSDVSIDLTWQVSHVPVFELSQNKTQNFNISLNGDLTVRDGQNSPQTETLGVIADCRVGFSTTGVLSFNVQSLNFETNDPFVKVMLEKKTLIFVQMIENFLSTIQLPMGELEGITFNGHMVEIKDSTLYVSENSTLGVSIEPINLQKSGLGITLSNGIIQDVVNKLWWEKAPKSFRPNSDTTVNLNGYSFDISGGNLNLSLDMGGTYAVEILFGATARWSIDISTVNVTLNISINSDGQVSLDGGHVSTPSISLNPENAGAWVTTIVTHDIIDLILSSVMEDNLPDAINQHLNQIIYTIPNLNESFQGIDVILKPENLSLSVVDNQVQIFGDVSVIKPKGSSVEMAS